MTKLIYRLASIKAVKLLVKELNYQENCLTHFLGVRIINPDLKISVQWDKPPEI
jgi:hypothetical protein